MEKIITFLGQQSKVACDGKCNKAWGINSRPCINFDDDNPDDNAFLSDDELDEAPANPVTYEGGQGKPVDLSQFPNKWCVRECERCKMSEPGEAHLELELPDFSKRVYNQPWKHDVNRQ